MEMKPITIEMIISLYKNTQEEKRPKQIKSEITTLLYPDCLLVEPQIEQYVSDSIDKILKEDKKEDKNSYLIYNNGKYKKRKNRKLPTDVEIETIGTAYIGTAGECAVMSELLFRGYNANRMMVDDGVDIIAAKDNLYYYIQVKTTSVKDGRIYARINRDSFARYNKPQCRYIIVARYTKNNIESNMFFVFNASDIEQAAYEGCVNQGEESFNLKIKFNERTLEPILYDQKEKNISWNLNRFTL